LRIAIIADRLVLGGLETHLISVINELLKRGHQVLLNAAYINPKLLAQFNPTNSPAFQYQLWTEDPVFDVQRFDPEVIHAHPFTAIFRGFNVAQTLGKPLVVTIHGFYDFGVDRSPLGNQVSEFAKAIIAVDDGVAEVVSGSTAHPEKLKVIYNGIDLEQFTPLAANQGNRADYGLIPHWKTIVVVSRLADGKDGPIVHLLQVAVKLAKVLKGLNVVIVGDGDKRDLIQTQVNNLNSLGDLKIFFAGACERVIEFLGLADLVLACDRAALEAMACERAVFGMNAAGFAGAITNSNYQPVLFYRRGYRKYTDGQLIQELQSLLQHHNQLRTLALMGHSIVLRHFNIVDTVNRLETVYQQ